MPNGPWPEPPDRTDMGGETTVKEDGDVRGRPDQSSDGVVVRRSEQGWLVANEETADLTSAMVLADLLAYDLGSPPVPPAGPARAAEPASQENEAEELARPQPPARKRGRSPRHARAGENVGGPR
jgi:hypothetical protein